ncbi:hypothetical protein WCX72_06440 [Sulfurimonas sp. HSL1-6]
MNPEETIMTPGEIILGIIALFAVFLGVGVLQYNRLYEKEERQRGEQ